MTLLYLILIALIQGVTEFLPISSSAHLILLPNLTGQQDQGVVIDVAAHVGTLGAVILYFRNDVGRAIAGVLPLLRGQLDNPNARLALGLVVATVPVVIVGAVLKFTGMMDAMRNIFVIGWMMIIFGIVLFFADRRPHENRADFTDKSFTVKNAIILGLWQAVALIPGVSRSGIVITGGLFQGYSRAEAARISMLMSIPTIIASGAISSLDLIGGRVPLRDTSIVIGFSFVAAFIALVLMMRLLKSVSFTPYVIYRLVLGVALLVIGYSGLFGF